MVVSGAGKSAVNGNYRKKGTYKDRPQYRIEGGSDAILYWSGGQWKLSPNGSVSGWTYFKKSDADVPPSGVWETVSGLHQMAPPPTVQVGAAAGPSKTEVELQEEPQFADAFTFFLLEHIIRSGWATEQFCDTACRQLFMLLFTSSAATRREPIANGASLERSPRRGQ